MQLHSKKPRLPTLNAVYCLDDSSILICQNLDLGSRHGKQPALTKPSKASLILGNGYESFFVQSIKMHHKSMQKYRPPSFFPDQNYCVTPHALARVNCTVESNISCKCIWTSATNGRGICLNYSLNGVSLVILITCLVEWVQPSSLDSTEKTSWYSAKRDWAASANSGGHDSSLPRSNSSNSFSCHCFKVNLGCLTWLWSSSDASVELICTGSSGIWVTATALAPGVFFFTESGDMQCYSLPLQQCFYCHCISPYKHSVPCQGLG